MAKAVSATNFRNQLEKRKYRSLPASEGMSTVPKVNSHKLVYVSLVCRLSNWTARGKQSGRRLVDKLSGRALIGGRGDLCGEPIVTRPAIPRDRTDPQLAATRVNAFRVSCSNGRFYNLPWTSIDHGMMLSWTEI